MKYIGEIQKDEELINGNKSILIYGAGKYGEKIYRNLRIYKKENMIKAIIENNIEKRRGLFHGIPMLSIEEAAESYSDAIVCIAGKYAGEMETSLLERGIKNIHQIEFNINCDRWGTEYGGFYIPENFVKKKPFLVYSFGIGEDLSFSEYAIAQGGIVYAFDPTPKAIHFVKNHHLYSDPRFHFFPYGLSDEDNEVVFFLPVNTEYVSGSELPAYNLDCEHPIKVKMKRLRTILQELGHQEIDILKMDIEGSEFKVIKDIMDPALEKVKFKLLCVETHERFFTENNLMEDELYDTLRKDGFYDLYGQAGEPTFVKI